MAINKIIDENGVVEFVFNDIFGGGWVHDIFAIIGGHICPEKIERKLNRAGWHSSDSEIFFVKNEYEYIVHLDETDSICIYSNDKECPVDFLEAFAKTIDEETLKLLLNRK